MSTEATQKLVVTAHQVNNTPGFKERFWSKVDKSGECWLWTAGKKSENGYGHVKVCRRTLRTHRASWMMAYGEIPEGKLVCHKCDTPSCVRPDHLFLGTSNDNSADKVAKGRQPKGESHPARMRPERMARGECHGVSKLTDEQVVEIRRRYAAGGISQEALGVEYGMHQTAISAVVRRKWWQHIP